MPMTTNTRKASTPRARKKTVILSFRRFSRTLDSLGFFPDSHPHFMHSRYRPMVPWSSTATRRTRYRGHMPEETNLSADR
jgi:hypothetical protein